MASETHAPYMKESIRIFGSCVTRDAFEYIEKREFEIDYFARSSIISVMAPPNSNISLNDIGLDSKFQATMLFRDLSKAWHERIATYKTDFLIIDLIDERLDILRYDNSVCTISTEFNNAAISNKPTGIIQKRLDLSLHEWKVAAKAFTKEILSVYEQGNIIIHEAYWCSVYIDTRLAPGYIHAFPSAQNDLIRKHNKLLRKYYRYLRKLLPRAHTIKVNGCLADAAHKWGLSPFHYETKYYKIFASNLLDIIDGVN